SLLTYYVIFVFLFFRRPPIPILFPYTTLFRSILYNKPRGKGSAKDAPTYTASDTDVKLNSVATTGGTIICAPSSPRTRTGRPSRSEEHTSELQSRGQLVCRLRLEKNINVAAGV